MISAVRPGDSRARTDRREQYRRPTTSLHSQRLQRATRAACPMPRTKPAEPGASRPPHTPRGPGTPFISLNLRPGALAGTARPPRRSGAPGQARHMRCIRIRARIRPPPWRTQEKRAGGAKKARKKGKRDGASMGKWGHSPSSKNGTHACRYIRWDDMGWDAGEGGTSVWRWAWAASGEQGEEVGRN